MTSSGARRVASDVVNGATSSIVTAGKLLTTFISGAA